MAELWGATMVGGALIVESDPIVSETDDVVVTAKGVFALNFQKTHHKKYGRLKRSKREALEALLESHRQALAHVDAKYAEALKVRELVERELAALDQADDDFPSPPPATKGPSRAAPDRF